MLGLAAGLSIFSAIPAFAAGTWHHDQYGWWYYDNGWYVNCWQWIDGNDDGIKECYYFNQDGYCLTNTTTPDGYTVNGDGAWVVDGVVQTQVVEKKAPPVLGEEVDASQLEILASANIEQFDSEQTAAGTTWTNGYSIDYTGYITFKLDKKFSQLKFKAVTSSENKNISSATPAYLLLVQKKDTEPIYNHNMLKDINNVQDITLDVSDQDEITIAWTRDVWGKQTRESHKLLLKDIKFR